MANEVNNINNRPKIQPKNDNKKTIEEAAKIAYEESIFSKGAKIHKAITKDIPEKIVEKSQSWEWVKKLQEFFGIKPQETNRKQKNNQKNL